MTNLKNAARDYWLAQVVLCGGGIFAWVDLRGSIASDALFDAGFANYTLAQLGSMLPDTYAPETVETLCRRGAWKMANEDRDCRIAMKMRAENRAADERITAIGLPFSHGARYIGPYDWS